MADSWLHISESGKIKIEYEYIWGDDPCDITTEIVEELKVESILQVAGSGDHLFSFATTPQFDYAHAFDIDERSLAFIEFKKALVKQLNFEDFCNFFNVSSIRNQIKGNHSHPILSLDNKISDQEFISTFTNARECMPSEFKKFLELDPNCVEGIDSIASLKKDARFANPNTLPWLSKERYNILKGNLDTISLFKASLDPKYGLYVNDLVKNNSYDLVWPINALDHGVDFLPFLNFCTQNTKKGGYVMILHGIKDPYICVEEAFDTIVNQPNETYKNQVNKSTQKPTWNIYLGDVFEELGFELEKDLLFKLDHKYFPREENVWWDDDIRQSWSHRDQKNILDVLTVYKKNKEISSISASEFSEMAKELPKYFRRGLITSKDL